MKLNKTVNPNTRYLTALTLYVNYAFQGIATIILAQQMTSLMAQLNTDQRGIATVISVIGWGRLITVLFIGALSDRYGRKPIILVGMACYVIFFGGILISTNIWAASFFALFAGVANSFLDTGTYPALAELFPKSAGPATVLLRSFITIGQFSLPFLVTFLVANDLYYGYSFILMIALIMINGIIIFKRTISSEDLEQEITENSSSNQPKVTTSFIEKPKFMIEGIGLIILGFTAVATFSIIVTWLPLFAQEVSGMSEIDALRLVSIYSFTAFISIFVTSTLVKTVFKPVSVLLIYTSISLIALIALQLNPTPMMNMITAGVIGFFAAGGLFQLALSILLELFPGEKGRKTAMMSLAAAIQALIVPQITGILVDINVAYIITFNIFLTLISVIISVIIHIRYNYLTQNSKQ